ncbi:MAG: Fe-S protein assembly co-chaperone HscB [Nitrososphaerota archaeon]
MSEQIQNDEACWSCGASSSGHFCRACGRIQPVQTSIDYFTFIGIPQSYQIDSAELEHLFYDLSRRFHPDYFANATAQERACSADRSSMLNDAYRTLKDKYRRARYLLKLHNVNLSEGKTPPDLLAEVFELNEQMEQMRQARLNGNIGEAESLKQDLEQMRRVLLQRVAELEETINTAFGRWQASVDPNARRRALEEVAEALSQTTYLNNLIEDIEELY